MQEGDKATGGDKCNQWNTVLGTLRSQADLTEVQISVSILKIWPGLERVKRQPKARHMCDVRDNHT